MKVQRTTSTSGSTGSVQKAVPRTTISFAQMLGDQERDAHDQEELRKMLQEIEKKGRQLVENRTVETLLEYKEMIRGFVEEAVQFGLRVEDRRSNSRTGRSKIMKVVATIDEKLLELTNLALDQERPQIKLMEKIGQIQGLLVNLYA